MEDLTITRANGTTIAWAETGSGAPLVLLHGLADSHRTWRGLAEILGTRFRVLMPDLPGHGLSGRPDAPYTLEWYADTLAAWLEAIGVERAHMCGHSFGGGVAQWMLLGHRRRVDRLALVAAGGLGREVGAALRLAALPIAAPFLATGILGNGTRFLMPMASRSFAARGVDEVETLAWLNGAPRSGMAFRRTVTSCIGIWGQNVQTWQHISKIESLPPLAVFWGEQDAVIPVEHAHEIARRMANVTVHVYPGCGHFLHLEATARLAKDLGEFLEGPAVLPVRANAERGATSTSRRRWRMAVRRVGPIDTPSRRSSVGLCATDS